MVHKPVLVKEVLQYLDPKPNENFIDCTVGQAGHTIEILKKNGPGGRVLGIDLDSNQIENAKINTSDFKERITLVNDSYSNLKEIVEKTDFKPVNGILLDLGMSSWHLGESKRGFSFRKNEILDMRYDIQNVITAEKIVNEYSEAAMERILRDFGQERFARKIAKEIVKQRKIKRIQSTFQLKNIIEKVIPKKLQHGRTHCATKSFQALRIEVNGELDNLIKVLPQAISLLHKGGRLVVISFHSLEDKIVKDFFKQKTQEEITKIFTKKPITALKAEILKNPKSRSAKLRAIIKI